MLGRAAFDFQTYIYIRKQSGRSLKGDKGGSEFECITDSQRGGEATFYEGEGWQDDRHAKCK